LAAGGGRTGTDHLDAQIYSPPYLFKPDGSPAERPTITSAPTSIGYGETFSVATPNAADISAVTLLRLGSVTHKFNMNQRFDRLRFTPSPGGLTVVAPAGPNLAPPGHYMLFVLNGRGVPSAAKIIRID
jgi:hypothetical protein